MPDTGVASINVPVVTSADYVFDAAAPNGALGPRRSRASQRLVPGPRPRLWRRHLRRRRLCRRGSRARSRRLPASYGMIGFGRCAGHRRRRSSPASSASWSAAAAPRFPAARTGAARPSRTSTTATCPNFGCGVNSNIAAMVANPQDLIHGREGAGTRVTSMQPPRLCFSIARTPPSGSKGLQEVNTKSGGN